MSNIFSDMPPVVAPARTVVASAPVASTTVQSAIPAAATNAPATDTVEIQKTETKKQGPIKKLKTFIANIKKAFASAGEYIKGGAKGIASGAVAGSLVYTGGAIINGLKDKAALKAGQEAGKKIPNKFLAGAVALVALGVNIWNASLNATEKRSQIDHRWTGHNQ